MGRNQDDGDDQGRGRRPKPRAVRKSFVLREDELEALRRAALRSGRSIPELLREAIRRFLGLGGDGQR
jgi:hypothetical protein